MSRSVLLVIDTATSRLTLALRRAPGARIEDGSTAGPDRGASGLGTGLAAFLRATGVAPSDLAAIGVGLGPGSFTGLRVGLATAKTLAWSAGVPLAGIATADALRRAAGPAGTAAAIIQSAGARDHYLALPGEGLRLLPPGTDLAAAAAGRVVLALGVDPARLADCPGPDGLDPLAAGAAAQAGLGVALLDLLEERLSEGALDDVAALVPAYVALPRGITTSDAAWTPELR